MTRSRPEASGTALAPSVAAAESRVDAPVLSSAAPAAAAAATFLDGVADGLGTLLLLQASVRGDQAERGRSSAAANADRAEHALDRQREAQEALAAAQERVDRMRWAPRWVKRLIAAIITAVGAVAGAFSGGAAAGLAVAGAVLILAGDYLPDILERAGVDPRRAAWAGFAVKMAGTLLSLGAGAAGGAASAAGSAGATASSGSSAASSAAQAGQTVELTRRVVRVLETVNTLVSAATGITTSVFTRHAELASSRSDVADIEHSAAVDQQADDIELVREAEDRYRRVTERVQELLRAHDETARARAAHLSG